MAESWTLLDGGWLMAKVTLSSMVPALGPVVDVLEAGKCFYYGDNVGGAINIVSALAGCVTLGLGSHIKNAMGVAAKGNVIQSAKEFAKSAPKEAKKKLGTQISKYFATGMPSVAVDEVWRKGSQMTFGKYGINVFWSGLSSGGHEICETIFKDFGRVLTTETIESLLFEMTKQSKEKFAFEFAHSAAKTGAEEVFKNKSFLLHVKDFGCSFIKGSIRRYNNNDLEDN